MRKRPNRTYALVITSFNDADDAMNRYARTAPYANRFDDRRKLSNVNWTRENDNLFSMQKLVGNSTIHNTMR